MKRRRGHNPSKEFRVRNTTRAEALRAIRAHHKIWADALPLEASISNLGVAHRERVHWSPFAIGSSTNSTNSNTVHWCPFTVTPLSSVSTTVADRVQSTSFAPKSSTHAAKFVDPAHEKEIPTERISISGTSRLDSNIVTLEKIAKPKGNAVLISTTSRTRRLKILARRRGHNARFKVDGKSKDVLQISKHGLNSDLNLLNKKDHYSGWLRRRNRAQEQASKAPLKFVGTFAVKKYTVHGPSWDLPYGVSGNEELELIKYVPHESLVTKYVAAGETWDRYPSTYPAKEELDLVRFIPMMQRSEGSDRTSHTPSANRDLMRNVASGIFRKYYLDEPEPLAVKKYIPDNPESGTGIEEPANVPEERSFIKYMIPKYSAKFDMLAATYEWRSGRLASRELVRQTRLANQKSSEEPSTSHQMSLTNDAKHSQSTIEHVHSKTSAKETSRTCVEKPASFLIRRKSTMGGSHQSMLNDKYRKRSIEVSDLALRHFGMEDNTKGTMPLGKVLTDTQPTVRFVQGSLKVRSIPSLGPETETRKEWSSLSDDELATLRDLF